MLAGLLAELDSARDVSGFCDHVCEALCRLTSLERAVLFLYEPATNAVRSFGSSNLDKALMGEIEATLEEAPIAQRALAEDRVIEVSSGLENELPARYARVAGITTVTCGPVAAGGRWFGVIIADRGGGRFKLSAEERQTMLTLGRLAALATSVERATSQRERAHRLRERVALMGEIHERVMQRLFGLSLALGSGESLSDKQLLACHDELQAALGELRTALREGPIDGDRQPSISLQRLLEGHAARTPGFALSWQEGVAVPARLEGLSQSVFREAMRNTQKHAVADRVEVRVAAKEGAFELEIINNGMTVTESGGGLGLKLLAMEALQHDALFEFGPLAEDRWRVRLVAEMLEPRIAQPS
ncbi:MAG: GAF domain-containing protein [Actinomycetota bacterium]|nr:GAF domain-containing protein [Actinomycetota bacterium]